VPGGRAGEDEELGAEAVEELLEGAMAGVEAARPVEAAAEVALEQTAEDAVAEAVELASRFEAERDEYLDMLRRLQAEFENYRRRVEAQREEQRAQAAADLVRELLPVLDACDAAVAAGHGDVEPVRAQLLGTLEKHGLSTVAEAGVSFDPHVHEAVLHEEGDGEPVVAEVLRTGYLWNDRVVRAAMVKVRG
jgi:molecular chaperone GrpE